MAGYRTMAALSSAMSHDDDADRPQLRPIPGTPIGAPNPPFPGERPEPRLEPKEPQPEQVHEPDSILGPSELAARLEELKKSRRYADKLGLETHCEIGNPGFQYPHWRKIVPKKEEASEEDDEP